MKMRSIGDSGRARSLELGTFLARWSRYPWAMAAAFSLVPQFAYPCMMRSLRVATGTLAAMLLGVLPAVPQPETVLSDLAIDLRPDYDRPGVLVIHRATIAPEVSLPTRVVFRMPAAAGLPSAVAERLVDGRLMTLPYERTVEGETAVVDLTASRPIVQFEYYDPAIVRDGPRRNFAFTYSGDFEVRNFSISVQQPHLAQNFVTVPEATGTAVSADGLVHHTLSRAGLKKGESVTIRASYEKVSDQLSVETITPVAVSTPPPAAGNAAAAAADGRTVPIVLGAMFVCAGAGVVALMVRTRRQAGSARRSTRRRGTARSRRSGDKATRFCTQCGAGVGPGDRFCQRCGSSLK